jgi:cytochrome c2
MSGKKFGPVIAVILLFTACSRPETPAPPPAPPPIGDAARGKQLATQQGCNVCHIVPGIEGAQGSLGPTLAGVASRPKISNGVVTNTPENLAKLIENPQALNPESTMPALGISTADSRDIAAFLLTLK